ncbi:ligand-binding sensor domain-containing diguanylate cyclase [Pelomonas sp. SE-A7]|uniref:ligand-binding sensor domain-containing diguanylate cyclase n=1 Tax=Pelomonas sp. SE-A7 TaxID=3054953 RepID=UPI00259D2E68|nr:ligand-binding sensor domain-containing diguanylate cyclase [Pelomonas sp. SE-A7]MDM4768461.1 diguanylate cyclase [Pelomonas sp. SE-A7]
MSRLRTLSLACSLLLLSHAALGARPSETLEVQFRSVPVPQNTVPMLAQDQAGFIWVATSTGLTRYDGYRLRPIEQAGETRTQRNLGWVRALAPTLDGRMWIGTEFMGLMAYDPEQDRVERFGGLKGAAGPHSPIRALADDGKGSVWVGTMGQGLVRYRQAERRFEAQDLRWQDEAEARVLALRVARDGTVWVGHWRGLSRLEGKSWRPVAGFAGDATVQALAEASDGRLWLGTLDGRLGVVEQNHVRWVQDLKTPIQALAEADEGRLWVGSKTGLLWVDMASGHIELRLQHDPRHRTGLAGNDISALLRDRSGALWVSGYGLGLQRHQQHPALAVRGPDEDLNSPLTEIDVRALLTLKNGEVLAPTQKGAVVRLDGRPGAELALLGVWPRERNSVVESLAQAPDGSLWMASAGLLEHRTAEGRLLRSWPLDGGRAQRLLLRASGEIWLGMQEGLYRLAGPEAKALERVHPASGAPLHGGIYALIEEPSSGRLWVGGQQGLFRERDGPLEPVQQAPGDTLGSPVVMALLLARDGTLWVDTPAAGLHRLIGWDLGGRARFERIGERHGTEGVFGGNLHEDAQGRIWSQLNVYDPKADRLDSFGPAEGADFGTFWFFASTRLPDGALVFGGSRGLLRIRPELYSLNTGTVPLVISALRADGQPFHPESLQNGVLLPAGTRTLGIEFAGLDYADPGRLRYQYRLRGLDTHWTQADGSSRSPSFGPLKPGDYVLQVRAAPQASTGRVAELELPVKLLPLWWQTLWAQLAGALLFIFGIAGWIRWRTRQLRRRESELQALVDARTAELREASLTDTLTSLRNRRYLELRLPDDLRLCLRRHESPVPPGPDSDLVLMLLDLDHFKRINDLYGHSAGDAVLVQLAERLREVFRDTDSLVRWGGEEVLVLVRETHREDAPDLAARACAIVREQPFDLGSGHQLTVTASIGFAAFPLDRHQPRAWDWSACLALADSALYAAKARGRDGYVGATDAQGLTPFHAPRDLEDWRQAEGLSVHFSTRP